MPVLNENDVYAMMGFTLSYLQAVEKTIKFCSQVVLQGEEALNFELLQRLEEKERKKALGYFAGKIKERAQLHPTFENLLEQFIEERNNFVHNQDKIPGWDLGTDEGAAVAHRYTVNLLCRAHRVNEIFALLMKSWADQVGIEAKVAPEQEAYINALQGKYGHLTDVIFTQKET